MNVLQDDAIKIRTCDVQYFINNLQKLETVSRNKGLWRSMKISARNNRAMKFVMAGRKKHLKFCLQLFGHPPEYKLADKQFRDDYIIRE